MAEIKTNFGGASIDDEASEKSEGQQNDQVQPTNSDAQTSADPQTSSKKFVNILNEQAQSGKDEDKDIIRIIHSWAKKPTLEAQNHYNKGYSIFRYIGKKLAQASVPFKKALEYLIKKYPDLDPEYIKSELAAGYKDGAYNEKLRDYILRGGLK